MGTALGGCFLGRCVFGGCLGSSGFRGGSLGLGGLLGGSSLGSGGLGLVLLVGFLRTGEGSLGLVGSSHGLGDLAGRNRSGRGLARLASLGLERRDVRVGLARELGQRRDSRLRTRQRGLRLNAVARSLAVGLPPRHFLLVEHVALGEQVADGVRRLGTDAQPVADAVGFQRDLLVRVLLHWVVPTQVLEHLAVETLALIDSSETVERTVGAAEALETETDHGLLAS